jgi:hypothetical protein
VLTQCKESLIEHELVIIVDYVENYCSMVQDAVQGYNFSREKATLHPVIIHTYRYI